MNYDRTNASGRENKSFSSPHNYNTIKAVINAAISSKPFKDAEEQRNRERAIRYYAENQKCNNY